MPGRDISVETPEVVNSDVIYRELCHRSNLFPDLSSDIDLTCTLESGLADEFAAWAEIQDSTAPTAIKLSDIVAVTPIHISAVRIRWTSDANLLYLIELGYGLAADAVTILDVHQFGSGTKKIDSDEQGRVRPPVIPKGQKVYYRMLTEDTLNATAKVVIRYHKH